MEELPEDLIKVILDALCRISKVSVVVLAHVSEFWYRRVREYAGQNKINRVIECHQIAKIGSKKMLKWAKSMGYHWDIRMCACAAAECGSMEIIKWIRPKDCKYGSLLCTKAAKNGHLHFLMMVVSDGGKWNHHTCASAAITGGHLEVFRWIMANSTVSPATVLSAKQKWPNEIF